MIQAISVTTADHTTSISRTAHYTASYMDNNKTLACMITQEDRTEVLLKQSISINLSIKKRRVAAPLIKQVPLLSGVLFLIIFLLLSCILLTLLIVRHRGKERKRKELARRES